MKKKSKLLLAVAMALLPSLTFANTSTLDTSSNPGIAAGVTWLFTDNGDGTATVTAGYEGTDVSVGGTHVNGNVTLPDEVKDAGGVANGGNPLTIVGIAYNTLTTPSGMSGNGNFTNWRGITTVTFPATLVHIGRYVFSNDTVLTTVNFKNPLGWGSIRSIGEYAFCSLNLESTLVIDGLDLSGLTDTTIAGSIFRYRQGVTGPLTLPKGTKIINSTAFSATQVTSVNFTDLTELTSILQWAFERNTHLKSVDLSNCADLTNIGHNAFSPNHSLASLTLPANPSLTIDYQAFSNCDLRGDLVIPSATTSVSYNAFSNNASLRSVTFTGASLDMPGYQVFAGCNGLEYVDMSQGQAVTGLSSLSRASSTTTGHAFSGLPAHTVVYLPQGVPDSLIANSAPNNMNYVRLDKSGVEQCPWLYVQDGCDYYLPHAFTASRATWNAAGTGAETTPNATRRLAAGGYATAYLPYDFTLDDNNIKGYSLSYKDNHKPTVGTDNTLVFTQDTTGQYPANTPYVIRAVSGGAFPGMDATTNPGGIAVPATPVSRVTYAPDGTAGYDGATTAVGNTSGGEPVDDPVSGAWGFYGSTEGIPSGLWQSLGWNAYALGGGSWHPLTGGLGQMRAFIVGDGTPLTAKPALTLVNADGTRDTTTSIGGLTVTGGDGETRVYNMGGQYVGDDLDSLPKGIYVVDGRKVIK